MLEWHNQGCPYTRKHYASGNMQALQKEWTAKGVVWFTVISSAPGEQGYVTANQENNYLSQMHAVPTAALLDPQGKIGASVQRQDNTADGRDRSGGKVIYDGAIDNRPTPDTEDIKGAKNYVNEALTAAMAGKPCLRHTHGPMGVGEIRVI